MKHYENEINRFIDNQINEVEQKELFAHLSNCSECIALLNDYMEIKGKTNNFYKELSYEPGEKIFVLNAEKKNKYKYNFYFSAAAAVILGFLFLLNLNNKNNFEMKYLELRTKFISLEKSYNTLIENQTGHKISIKENEIRQSPKNELVNKRILTKKGGKGNNIPQEISHKKSGAKYASLQKKRTNFNYLNYIDSLPSKQITSNDFLTSQIIGN